MPPRDGAAPRLEQPRGPNNPYTATNGTTDGSRIVARWAAALAALPASTLAAIVALLPLQLLVAVRAGAEVALLRADHQHAERLRADYCGGRWHVNHPLPEITALDRARYPPTGDRDEWITYGPDGPPRLTNQEAA